MSYAFSAWIAVFYAGSALITFGNELGWRLLFGNEFRL